LFVFFDESSFMRKTARYDCGRKMSHISGNAYFWLSIYYVAGKYMLLDRGGGGGGDDDLPVSNVTTLVFQILISFSAFI
jgi:hypothetical protein